MLHRLPTRRRLVAGLLAGLFAFAWLPLATAVVVVPFEKPWPVEGVAWLSLIVAAVIGLPLSLARGALQLAGFSRAATWAFAILGPILAVLFIRGIDFDAVTIVIYAAGFSLPAWGLFGYLCLRRRAANPPDL